jgi:hypothetical protein
LWHLACLIAAGIYTIHMPIRSQDVYSVLWLSNLIIKIIFLKENFYLLQWENIVKIFFFWHSRFTSLYNELHVVAYLSTLNSLAVSDIFWLLLEPPPPSFSCFFLLLASLSAVVHFKNQMQMTICLDKGE